MLRNCLRAGHPAMPLEWKLTMTMTMTMRMRMTMMMWRMRIIVDRLFSKFRTMAGVGQGLYKSKMLTAGVEGRVG